MGLPILNIGLVTIYTKGTTKHSEIGGVASYTKNLVESLTTLDNSTYLTIFANRNNNEPAQTEIFEVRPCWRQGVLYPFQIFREAWKLRGKLDIIHVQHEYFLYGGKVSAILFPLLLILLMILKKPVVITMHGVVRLSELNSYFIEQNGLGGNVSLLKLGLLLLTKIICFLAMAVIVHEPRQKDTLVNEYQIAPTKIAIIPHGIEVGKYIPEHETRRFLQLQGSKVLLFFGYITRYKGLDTLVNAFRKLRDPSYVLFICGGEHPRLRSHRDYAEYLRKLRRKCEETPRIIMTGYVPEDQIAEYFTAADLVLLPYNVSMSSSGPMNLAISFDKPFLVSECLSFEGLDPRYVCKKDNSDDLASKIDLFFQLGGKHQPISEHIAKLKKENSWREIGLRTKQLYSRILTLHTV